MTKEEIIEDLMELQNEISQKMEEVQWLLNQSEIQKIIIARAEMYWIPQIKLSLHNETEYCGESMVTMEDTINEIKGAE